MFSVDRQLVSVKPAGRVGEQVGGFTRRDRWPLQSDRSSPVHEHPSATSRLHRWVVFNTFASSVSQPAPRYIWIFTRES